jgi:hypothetical protein
MDHARHLADFREHARRRRATAECWPAAGPLDPAVVRSIQRFQVGESGDGESLIARSERAGDPDYAAAVRLFVAEEQNHGRLLAELLAGSGAPTIEGDWTDVVFVAMRRAMGLRWELMTLMTAEVVALRYYRALRDGTADARLRRVAGAILADERRHVPFHVDRLREGFSRTRWPGRAVATAGWWALMVGVALVVAAGHGAALRALGVGRARFVIDVLGLFRPLVDEVFGGCRR